MNSSLQSGDGSFAEVVNEQFGATVVAVTDVG